MCEVSCVSVFEGTRPMVLLHSSWWSLCLLAQHIGSLFMMHFSWPIAI